MTAATTLNVSDLRVGFLGESGWLEAVRDVSFNIQKGEALGLVGESGSGKTLTGLAIMGLVPSPGRVLGGAISIAGQEITSLAPREIRKIRGDAVSMVFQDPLTALNPVFTIGRQLIDVIVAHQAVSKRQARQRAVEVLRLVGLSDPEARLRSYAHELSGGMRQRVLIGMAMACRPRLLIADEPTTALDVTVQAQMIRLINRLRQELEASVLFITHNLDLAAEFCDRILVMYAGKVVEEAPVEAIFTAPAHPYTQALTSCIPRLSERRRALSTIEGSPPTIGQMSRGCAFAPRCPHAMPVCSTKAPELYAKATGHRVACWLSAPSGGGLNDA
jgi:peptide/nickel transport system ATP-binding protein